MRPFRRLLLLALSGLALAAAPGRAAAAPAYWLGGWNVDAVELVTDDIAFAFHSDDDNFFLGEWTAAVFVDTFASRDPRLFDAGGARWAKIILSRDFVVAGAAGADVAFDMLLDSAFERYPVWQSAYGTASVVVTAAGAERFRLDGWTEARLPYGPSHDAFLKDRFETTVTLGEGHYTIRIALESGYQHPGLWPEGPDVLPAASSHLTVIVYGISPVPEPSSLAGALIGAALVGTGAWGRRRWSAA